HRATLLVASAAPGPMPVFLGVLVPAWPPLVVLPGTTDATGARALAVPGGGGPADFWLQSLIDDPGASAGVGFSNAIRLTFLPWRRASGRAPPARVRGPRQETTPTGAYGKFAKKTSSGS